MPKYKVNGRTFNIPDNEVDLFEADFPEAQLHYQTNNGRKFTIYANERKDFLSDFPDATELGWSETIKEQAKQGDPFQPEDNLAQAMYGSLSYQDNIGTPQDNLYYPSPLNEEGRADYDPLTPEERSKQEYEMLMRHLDEFNAANGDMMDTYEAYEKAARHQVNEGGFAIDTPERRYLDENHEVYHARKEWRDDLNERIKNNSYFNQMRMAESDAANEAADGIANLAAQERAENHKLDLQYNLWNMQHQMPYSTGPSIKRALSPEALEHGNAQEDLQAAERLYRKTAEIYAAPINNGEDIFKNFAIGAGQRMDDLDFWTMGLSAIADDVNARQALQKIQDKLGSVTELGSLTDAELDALLTPSEQLLVSAFMDNLQAMIARKDNTSGAFKAGQGAADSAMFMAQFLLTGGIGEAATTGTQLHKNVVNWLGRKIGGINNNIVRSIARGATKMGVGIAESIGKALVMTPLMPHTYANIADRLTEFDNKGELMDVTDAIFSGAADALIETWSESTGDFVNKVLGVPGDITKGVAKKVLKNVDFSDWGRMANAPIMKILKKGGFNGFLGEMGEEFIGNAVRSITKLEPGAFKEFTKLENLLVTAGSFAPMTIFGLGVSGVQYGWQKRKLDNAQKAFEAMLREASYTEDQVRFVIDELLGSTDAHLTPEKLVANFSPLLRELAFNDKFANNRTQALNSAIDLMWQIARYRTFDGVYHRQEEQQRNDMLAEIQEGTGREFWTTRLSKNAGLDGTAYETNEVRAVEFNDGRVAYVLGGDGVNNTVVYNDGQTGFLSEEQLNEGKANGSIVSDATMGLNDYLTQQVARVRMTEEEQRMFTERNTNIGQVRAQFPIDATVELGTTEAPIQGVVRQQTPNGVIVESPAGISQLTWEELGHTIGVEVNPQTDAQMEEEAINNLEIADLQRRRAREQRRAQRNAAAEAVLTEEQMVDEAENEGLEKPIPMKADGTVDQTAFWNESPARWAQWKTEQRQDGGAYASTYIQNAIGILEGQIAESEAAFLAESDFDAKDALEQTINQQKARLAELQDLAMQYMPSVIPAEANTEATAEQTQPSAETSQPAAVMADRQKFELDAEYQRRLSLARALAEKEMILKEYFEAISAGSMEAVVMNKKNYKQVMKDNGCDEEAIERVTKAIKASEEKHAAVNALHVNGKIFVLAEYNYTVEQGRVSYVHERQHNITKRNPDLIQRVLSLGLGRETLQKIVRRLSGTDFYDNESDDVLADEILSSTMEIAYTYDEFSVTLSKLGIPIELINLINEINNEQRNDYSLANARRNAIQYDNPQNNSGQNVGDQGEVSGGILGEERDGSNGDSRRGVENGGEGERRETSLGKGRDTGGAEASEEGLQVPVAEVEEESEEEPKGPDFRVTKPEDNLSDETKQELADKGLVMDGGAIMSEDYAKLKHETGYETPIERNTDLDDLRFSYGTRHAHIANYRQHPEAEKRVIALLERLAERISMNELVYGVMSTATNHKYVERGTGIYAGPLRENVEYVITFDLDTTCPRTFQYLNFVKRIEKRIRRPLTQTECIQLIEMMRMYGQQIPCVYCYAENKRQALKDGYTRFMNARYAVLSAETDEEALQYMYGRNDSGSADPKEVLTKAAHKVFLQWRKDRKSLYNPSMKTLWSQYTFDRNCILSLLDTMYEQKGITTDASDVTITNSVAAELGVTSAKAKNVIEEIVGEWKWDTIEGKEHDDFTPIDEDDWGVNERAFEVWRDMTNYAKSMSSAKGVIRYTPYTDELKYVSQEDRDYVNGMGGVRMHSTNDFRIDYVFDYFQFMADMALYKMFGHTYTKSPEFVRIFGKSGYKINMSIAAYQDENGNIRPNADEGFDWEEAKALRTMFPNAGVMLMATSDEQIQMALDSDWIDMIIPFHNSGLPRSVWYNMRLWSDYQNIQKEKFYNTDYKTAALKADGVIVPKKAKADEIDKLYNEHFGIEVIYDKTGKRIAPHFLPGPTIVDGNEIPGHNNDHQTYLDLCRRYGVKPRFLGMQVKDNTPEGGGRVVDITEHPRYMILVKETARTDTPQTPIQFNFDEPSDALGGRTPLEYAFDELEARVMAESELEGEQVTDIYNSLKKDQFGIVDQFIDTIIKHKEETGKDYPLDYITPQSRQWFLVERKALEEAFKGVETIPYHRNEYDEEGNLTKGEGLEREEVIDLVEEARKAQTKHDAKEKKGKKSDVSFRITPEQDKAYMDAVEAGDMETAQRMVDEAAEAVGYTIRGEHGRVSKFTIFDRDKANPEGNWGQGFYFSNNEEDVEENYATVEGPDLENKIEREVEKRVGIAEMNEEFNEDGEVDEFAIREEVEKEFITSEPNVVHAAIKMDKPFVVGHGMVVSDEAGNTSYDMQETYLDVEYEYDEDGEIDYYSEPTGTLIDLIDALNEEISNYDWANFNANEILQDAYDGMTASQFESAARELLNSHIDELVNDRGDVMTSEILRAAIERAGFDGIIDNTVNQKFGTQRRYGQSMAGMDSDTRHYISFDSSNIKDTNPVTYDDAGNVIPLSERFNPENEDIRFRMSNNNQAIFVSNAARAVEGIKQEKATPEQWLKMLEKAGGLKAGEDKWMGLSDWLKASDKKTLTKAEVLEFIGEHMIVIEEQHYEEDVLDEEALWYKYEESEEGMDAINYQMQLDAEAYAERELADSDLEGEEWEQEYERLVSDYIEDDLFGSARSAAKDAVRDLWMEEEAPKLMKGASREINSTRINYTTEGLDNLHEIALTVPTIESWNESDDIHFGDAGDGRAVAWIRFGETTIDETREEYENRINAYKEENKRDYDNYLQHLKEKYGEEDIRKVVPLVDRNERARAMELERRMNHAYLSYDYGKQSKRILVIDEIQSKRHQEGREKGYKDIKAERAFAEAKAKLAEKREALKNYLEFLESKYGIPESLNSERATEEEMQKLEDLRNAMYDADDELVAVRMANPMGSIPDAPFDKNWHELAMKRMLRYAAENGFDIIAWTTGDQQANRYDLSREVKRISASRPNRDGERIINIYYRDEYNDYKNLVVDKDGKVIYGDFFGSTLADVVGKEMSLQIMNAEDVTEFKGDGLKIGGEGMRGFYDKMLPAFMNKYGKKWGIKVEDINLPNLGKSGYTMHSVPVTEEMKSSVMEGQVMFRMRGEDESAEDFLNNQLGRFRGQYSTNAKMAIVDYTSRESIARTLGISNEELSDDLYNRIMAAEKKSDAVYLSKYNTIAIFAREEANTSGKADNIFFHENVHEFLKDNPHWLNLGQWLLDNSNSGPKKAIAERVKSFYPEQDHAEEMLCNYTGLMLSLGRSQAVMNSLPEEMKPIWEEILNKFNYNPEYEDSRRKSDRSGDEDARRDASVQMRNASDERARGARVTWTRNDSDSDLRFRTTEITPEVRDEMDTIAAIAIVNGNYMKAPNGKDSNLTAEQWAMVRTKNFKSWFGDWENDPENASKVVDENGEPMVVYHGTAGVINSFEDQQRSPGFWFVDREDVANGYAESASVEFGEDKNVIPVFLNIRNPRTEDAYGEFPAEFALKSYVENDNGVYQEFDTYEEAEAYRKENVPDGWVGASKVGDQHDLVERAVELGHDGVIMKNMHDQAAYAETRVQGTQTNYVVLSPSQIKSATDNTGEFSEGEGDIRFSIRTKPAPEKTGKGYKVFYLKDGKLYPPMVANLGGVDTPVGVWLDAEEGTRAGVSKTGRPKVKQGGKGTQGGSGTLAYRPGWHLGEIPYAIQFNRKDENGDRTLFPADFVWAEVEYANDVDYQEEAMSYGMNANGKFQHSLAGLPKLPTDGSYRYRTNPNPETDPWIITGAMKVNRLLTPSEVDQMVIDAGREPQKRQEGAVTDEQIEALNKDLGLMEEEEEVSFRVTGTPTEDVVAEGVSLSPAQLASLAGDIFAALPEDSRKKITDGLNGNILGLQDAILQIPTSLATKEEWNDEDRQMAEVVAEQMTKAVGIEMTRPFSASEALWTLYNAVNKSTDLVSEASRALVRRNLGFDPQTLEMEKEARDGVRFRTVGNASANAQASMYNRGAANVWTRLKEVYVDMHASVEELVKAIEKRSGKVAQGFENILMALNQQSSKGLAAMEAYEQKFLNKMFDEIRDIMDKTDFKYEDIVRYVILKHGLERNVKMAQRDAKAHYQEIYDDIIAKIKGMNPAQKRTYLTNAQLRDADAKAELARLQAVNTSALTPDQLRDHKKELAKAKKEATEAAEHLVRAQKIATMTEQDAQDELDKIFKKIEKGTDSVYKEMRENDYSGISSMFYDTLGVDRKNYATEEEYQAALMQAKADKYDNLGDIEGAAQMEVTLFENAVNTDNLWKSINRATKETLRQQYDANMISKDQYLNLRDMFEYYVPLRGFADNTAEDMYTYYRRPNSTGYTKPILGAEGRKTEAESPFGWIAAMAGSAIASNVKNEAKLALYYFVANRPDNGIATLSKTWFVHTPGDVDANGKKIFRPAYPPFSEDLSSASAKADYEVWQANMKNLQAQGLAYEAGQRLNLGNSVVNISDTNKPEHIVNVKVGGKDYTIVINGNPRAAQAINGDLNIETNETYNNVLLGPWLRWLSSVNTSYNPEFWATNMMRDVAFTIMAVNIKGDPNYRRKFFKNYRKALKVVSMVVKNEKGTLGNSYIEQQYKDFVKYGGVTGFTQIKDSETWEKEIEKYLKNQDADTTKAIKAVKDGLHAFHRFGESLEQVSRFAAFLTAVETGKSINEAINDAKEITVNFNRKGSGKRITIEEAKLLTKNNGQRLNDVEAAIVSGISYLAPIARSTIMFFNASVQALNAWFKLWKANKLRSLSWVIGYATVGVINALIHALVDDDDEYLDIPQYERRSSLMLGGNGVYFKWALPQEMSAFYALGELSVETIFGRNPHQSAAAEAAKVMGDMLPVNIAKIIIEKDGWVEAIPSQVKPFLELVRNEDYKGDVIFNEQKWLSEGERERTANWESAYKGTGRPYIEISKLLNNLTDSKDLDEAGWINIHPESLEHVVESMTGGVGRSVSKLFNSIMAAFNPEEDVTVRQFPFLNRFLTINDERYKNVHVNDVYDYYAAEAEHVQTLLKQYTKDRDADALKDLRSSDEYKWATIYSKYKKPIKKYQEAIRAADTTNERMELMKQQDELKRKMIKEISEL